MLVSIGHCAQSSPASLDLVDLLLACHARIRRFTTLAIELGRRSELASDEVVENCHRCERYFGEALPLHVEDEEERVLPRLRGRRSDVDQALAVMQRQHEEHRASLSTLLGALRSLRMAPAHAGERATLHQAAERLAGEFAAHLDAEEQIIFPAIRALLPREVQLAVVQDLRARRRLQDR